MPKEGTPFWGTLDSETPSTPTTDEAQTGFVLPQEGTPLREKSGTESTSKPEKVVIAAKKLEFPPNTRRRSGTSEQPSQGTTLFQTRLVKASPLIKKGVTIGVGLVVGIALMFILLIVSNIEFLNMADESDERMLWGSWWNPSDMMNLGSNGSVYDSSIELIAWGFHEENLTLTHVIDGEPYQSTWNYEITYTDTGDDRFLFMASYVVENNTITNEVDETSCIAYVDSPRGLEQDYVEQHRGLAPDWCDVSPLF
jgi:hypothetical protein